jgi:putative hydrolase of the HAD superfamily
MGMKFKGIILDLDNTLYSYHKTHPVALEKAVSFLSRQLKLDKKRIQDSYLKARAYVQRTLKKTASSHNRLLYFQKLCEDLGANPIVSALPAYQLYWDQYINAIKLFPGVREFLKEHKGKKIGVVTDLTADVQHQKLLKLNLAPWIDCIVTSEEVGFEKPHRLMFSQVLKKMGVSSSDVCMIGDDYEKDILGAQKMGIFSLWLNADNQQRNTTALKGRVFKSFSEIRQFLKDC